MNFFDILENLCKQHNTKVTNVLEKIGLSRSKGTAWRNGSIPNGEILVELAKYFNVSVDYLLGYSPETTKDPKVEKLLALADILNESQVAILVEMSKTFLGSKQ